MQKRITYTDQQDLREQLRRLLQETSSVVSEPSRAYSVLKPLFRKDQEAFYVLLLNGASEIISVKEVTRGLVNRTIVHPREVFKPAILASATSVIVAHNHPSGKLEPSSEDIDITKRLVKAGEVIGISVLDHIIFSDYAFYSMTEHGTLHE